MIVHESGGLTSVALSFYPDAGGKKPGYICRVERRQPWEQFIVPEFIYYTMTSRQL